MMCERGGCSGCEARFTHPMVPVGALILFILAVAAGRWLGFIA
jgi:hypothetical protein